MREWEWKFNSVDVRDFDGKPDTIVVVDVDFVLKDHDLDMVEMTNLSASFEGPSEDFTDYENVTPETLRDWVVSFHSRGNDEWLEAIKTKLVQQLEMRAATKTRVVRAKVVDQ